MYTYKYIYICLFSLCEREKGGPMDVCKICMSIYVLVTGECMGVCVHTHVYIYIYIYVCVCVCVCVRAYVRTLMCTYTRTHIYFQGN